LIAPDVLAKALIEFLPRQRWFAAGETPVDDVAVVDLEVLRRDWPALGWAEARVGTATASDRYQVLVALRPSGEPAPFLQGHPDLTLGELDTDAGPAYGYDALVDPDLAVELVHLMAPDENVTRARLVPGEQSNTSVVIDERLFLKVFRRLHAGPNPEVEVTRELFERAFLHVVEPVAEWRRGDTDLAVLQGYLGGGVDGWAMALTSLRDLFAVQETQPIPIISDADPAPERVDPSAAGGDFSGEAERLGDMTAELHVTMADVFGRVAGDAASWADTIDDQLGRAQHRDTQLNDTQLNDAQLNDIGRDRLRARIDALRRVDDPGPAIRVHGDYHLAQVMRTDEGWYVLDFEGEPARSIEERRRPTSALKDVAGMLRSLHYASMVAMFERDEEHTDEAAAWEQRNREAFLTGYLPKARAAGVVPDDETSTAVVLAAFETEKALYELGYEQALRPDWARIPLAALRRLAVE
jgi:maltokinase